MHTRSMLAIATLALSFATTLPMERAEAKTDVDINVGIGFGGGHFGPGYGHGYLEPAFEPIHSKGTVSCSKARKVLGWNGFNKVKAVDCSALSYRSSCWYDGQKYSIRVNSLGNTTRISSY